MKKINNIFLYIAVVSLVLSCAREVEQTQTIIGGYDMEFSASWGGDEEREVRSVLQDDGASLWWSAAERIKVFCGSQYSGVFVSTNEAPAPVVTFRGTLETLTGDLEVEDGQPKYWAVYPSGENMSCSSSSVTVTLPHIQKAKAGGFADQCFPAIATSTTTELAFWNVCGGARFSVSTEGIQKIVFRSSDGTAMAGRVKFSFGSNRRPVVSSIPEPIDSIVVEAPEGGFMPGMQYFASMLPRTHSQGLTLTFYKANKRAEKKLHGSIAVKRSTFGTLENVDKGLSNWEDYAPPTEGGGSRSGLYLGIIGFNQELYKAPIERMTENSFARFNSFIDDLATRKGTLLYNSVDESLAMLSRARYPEDLFNVSLITFTDALDQGSSMVIEDYPGDEAYLQGLNNRMTAARFSGIPLTAYSIGLRGSDVTDVNKFLNNLRKLAVPESNAYEVSNMSTVRSHFLTIADQLSQTLTGYSYDLSVSIPGQANGTRVRFTLDNASSATASTRYIEGTFNLSSKTLTDVEYHGISADSGTTVQGKVSGIFVEFTFAGLVFGDGSSDSFTNNMVFHWDYINSTGKWQKNSEFDAANDCIVTVHKKRKSAMILLNLDCSSSLESSFSTLKSHAKSFINSLYSAAINPQEVNDISLDVTEISLMEGKTYALTATVTPSTVENKSVIWTSSNPAVASVSSDGVVTGVSTGTCVIEAKTVDGGYSATCKVNVVISELVDLGLSVKWASCNLGASTPEDYGYFFAWGETEPKSDYSWDSYKWCMNGSRSQLTKYCDDSSYGYNGFRDGKMVLEPDDDAAFVLRGGDWRMPTYSEFEELRTQCTWTWTTINGVNGRKVTSKKSGYTDKWIFIPAAGYMDGSSQYNAGFYCYYWSSSINTKNPFYAFDLYFNKASVDWDFSNRCYGFSFRPVFGKFVRVSGVSLDQTSIGLYEGETVTLKATVLPSEATDKSVTWTSSNPAVATVSAGGVVHAVNVGTCTIDVTSIDGGYTDSCDLKVMEHVTMPEAVDLGLSVKWASFNVGASAPEDYGVYYAWGETEPKSNYSWNNYKWCMNGSYSQLTKYCNNSSYSYSGYADGKTILDYEDDVATVNWGGGWRMPTYVEFEELKNNCTWELTTLNGVKGRKVTSNKEGYMDKWIFLPAAGYRNGTSLYYAGSGGYYWSASLSKGDPRSAYDVDFNSGNVGWGSDFRYYGRSVRPVYGESIHVNNISINRAEVTLTVGASVLLSATISPENALEKGVTWQTSDDNIVTVNAYGLISGITAGTAVITVKSVDGGYTATCTVTVTDQLAVPDAVDLGLSVKWASFNLGATQPEDYGAYYAWGEIEPKRYYEWSTYNYLNNEAATVKLGGDWRMPTYIEYEELMSNCTWEWTTINGVYGRKVTSNKSGYTNKWIFLPAAGYRNGTSLYYAGSGGYYWSSSLNTDNQNRACGLYFYSGYVTLDYDTVCCNGLSVRPVYGEYIHVNGISLNRTETMLTLGASVLLSATIYPEYALEKRVVWDSSNNDVATISDDGRVTGIAAGTADITVKSVDGGYTATCTVTVTDQLVVPDAVDLGLSVKWASFNLGATQPEDYGAYYAWGEVEPKSNYVWATYNLCKNSSSSQLTKYCTYSNYGYNGLRDNKTVLEPEDDAATVKLGGDWRIPTGDEFEELMSNCTWEWTSLNGVYGSKVTSKKSGYTNKWIFLPATGYRAASTLYYADTRGYYWSSSLVVGSPGSACSVLFSSGVVDWNNYYRCCGRSVRPVCE